MLGPALSIDYEEGLTMESAAVTIQTRQRGLFAVASAAIEAGLTAIGTFSGDNDHEWRQYLIVLGIIVVATAIIFYVIVPRIDRLGRGALILGVLAVLTIPVFWLGLPVLFAGAAALLALPARERADERAKATAALALATLAAIAAIAFAFLG
jgi:hypothetical protein